MNFFCFDSPKSPPNSPNNELEDNLGGYYINYSNKVNFIYLNYSYTYLYI